MMGRDEETIEVEGCNQTWRKKELKHAKKIEAALYRKKMRGTTKRETCKTKDKNRKRGFRGNRLYLGKPRCGGLVWTPFGRDEAGLGTSHRGDPMPVPLWHSTKSLCTRCLWAGLDTSGCSPKQSKVQCGSLQQQRARLHYMSLYYQHKCNAK